MRESEEKTDIFENSENQEKTENMEHRDPEENFENEPLPKFDKCLEKVSFLAKMFSIKMSRSQQTTNLLLSKKLFL